MTFTMAPPGPCSTIRRAAACPAKGARQVDLEHRLPLAQGQLQERLTGSIASVVDENVHSVQLLGELVDRLRALVHGVQIEVAKLAAPAELPDLLHRLFGACLVAMPGDA